MTGLGRLAVTGLGRRQRLPAPIHDNDDAIALEAKGLMVERAGRPILIDVDLTVRHGETLALVGPNGAGKSTLLGALCGDLRPKPTAGTVTLAGAPLSTWTPRELAMRRSMLPQRHMLSFPFTVAEVVRMGRVPWAGTPFEDEDDAAVDQAMRDAEVTEFEGRPFPSLSGGEQARVALARVLAQRAAIVLLDEPTAALDIRHQELVFAITRTQTVRGHAVVAVVHDLGLAAAYADKVAVLSAGRMVAFGAPDEVLTSTLLSEVYQYDIEVLSHPRTGRPLILPSR